jgi:hypothetical protein
MNIELGDTAQDRITGFQGVVTGLCYYISGCNQALIVPEVKDGAFREAQWFDVQRLHRLENVPRIILDNGSTPGHDKAAPKR